MNPLRFYAAYRRLQGSQWLDRDAIRTLQGLKLRRLINHAYRHVPFYRERFDAAGVKPEAVRSVDDLSQLPITTKRDLLDAGPAAITSDAFSPDELVSRRTTGSTGEPFTLRVERHWIAVQRGLFLRALRTAGWRFGRKLVLASDVDGRHAPRWLRWRYLPHELSPWQLRDALQRERPDVLYGWVTPLRQLALHVSDSNGAVYKPTSVITTAEALDDPTRTLLSDVFSAEVFDFYGLTEMGTVAWECDLHDGLHLAEDTAIVECLPEGESEAGGRLVMTNLELLSMPLLRYQTGDVGEVDHRPCACGRGPVRLKRIEGRLVDCVRLRDGQVISPYRLTLVIESIPGVRRYRVIQEGYKTFTVEVEHCGEDLDGTNESIRRAVKGVVGEDATVRITGRTRLDPPPGRKFRVVESLVRAAGGDPCAS